MNKLTASAMSAVLIAGASFAFAPAAVAGDRAGSGYGIGSFDLDECAPNSGCTIGHSVTSGSFAFFGRTDGVNDHVGGVVLNLTGEDLFIGHADNVYADDCFGGEGTISLAGSGKFLGFGFGGFEGGDFEMSFNDNQTLSGLSGENDSLSGVIDTDGDTILFGGNVERGFIQNNVDSTNLC